MSAEVKIRRIALSEPVLNGNEWNYVRQCLDTGWVSSAGAFVTRFERAVAELLDTKHGVATSSGTAALHLALLACDVGAEDEVLMPAITFIAPANAVRYVGAVPVFIDIVADTLQLDVEAVREFLESEVVPSSGQAINRRTGRRIKALLPVHLLGHPVDMDPLLELARRFGLKVIEDASQAIGAKYRGRPVGALGDVGCVSFNGNKTITCGGGGMLIAQDEQLAALARHLSTQARISSEEFIHDRVGYNYRLSNVHAAIGLAQIEQLATFLNARTQIHEFYRREFSSMRGVKISGAAPWAEPSYWLSTARISSSDSASSARTVRDELAARGIETRPLWQPLHQSAAMQVPAHTSLPVAELAYAECLCLPSSSSLSEEDLAWVVDRVRASVNR